MGLEIYTGNPNTMDAEAGRLRLIPSQVQAWPSETLTQKQTKQSKVNIYTDNSDLVFPNVVFYLWSPILPALFFINF